MFRVAIGVLFLWFLFNIVNAVIIGQLCACNKIDGATEKKWLFYSVLLGPAFTVMLVLFSCVRYGEEKYEHDERQKKQKAAAKLYKDIFGSTDQDDDKKE